MYIYAKSQLLLTLKKSKDITLVKCYTNSIAASVSSE